MPSRRYVHSPIPPESRPSGCLAFCQIAASSWTPNQILPPRQAITVPEPIDSDSRRQGVTQKNG